MGDGWQTDRKTPDTPWTNTAGRIYLRNFGYPYASDYNLSVMASVYDEYSEASSHSFAVAINGHPLGSHVFSNDPTIKKANLEDFSTTISATLLLSGSDPDLVITDTTPYPATMRGAHGIAVRNVMVFRSVGGFVLPPLYLTVLIALMSLFGYVGSRRQSSYGMSIRLGLIFSVLALSLALTARPLLLPLFGLLALLALLFALFSWRRELANWLLHLRHPEDERFRMA